MPDHGGHKVLELDGPGGNPTAFVSFGEAISEAEAHQVAHDAKLRSLFDWDRAADLRYIDWFFATYGDE